VILMKQFSGYASSLNENLYFVEMVYRIYHGKLSSLYDRNHQSLRVEGDDAF
jgi:hypothetical protein